MDDVQLTVLSVAGYGSIFKASAGYGSLLMTSVTMTHTSAISAYKPVDLDGWKGSVNMTDFTFVSNNTIATNQIVYFNRPDTLDIINPLLINNVGAISVSFIYVTGANARVSMSRAGYQGALSLTNYMTVVGGM